MIQQADSLVVDDAAADAQQQQVHVHRQPTPAQVLRWLPRDATPEQQDSAIQANIKPSDIHWSSRPDTLHLPGQPIGKSFRDVNLPQYYRESFFKKSPYYHEEQSGGRLGVAGDPVPYTIAGDNLITSLLLGCFILAMIAFAQSRKFITRQAKNFFYAQRYSTTTITETSGELHFQAFLVVQTCLLLSLQFFFYLRTFVTDTFIIEQYQMIGIFTAVIAGYFLIKLLLYAFSGWVLFDKKQNIQWLASFLFLISIEGVALFPMVIVQAYFSVPMKYAFIYTLVVLLLFKILTFYKTYLIFFRRKDAILQIILYFCALEIIPMLSLWSALVTIGGYLKINF
jgi:hypothetical protein